MVVDGLDLDVPAGEIVGLIGANGAGKTTTVECIQGLRKPDEGRLRVLGFDPVTQAEQLRPLVGSQLQSSALPDRLRVAEALELFSTQRARDGGELLGQFGLTQRRRSVFSSLSGGERQRLFLVLALLNRPRLVILDELTQGLDPAARRTVWDAIRQLNDEGTTVLLVTHEMDEAEALCDRVAVMRAGHVIDAGAPADLVERHASTAVIRFSMPDPPAQLLDQVRRLDGVREVGRSGARITVRGHRRIVAHVCAALVRWEPVPADLAISQPGLEDALLGLLNGDHDEHGGRICQRRTDRRTAMSTTVGRLVRAELKLMTRDPLVLTFVFAFPIVTMLIIGGAFGTRPDPAFDGTNPSHWYVASYLTVVIAATGLVMLPVHLASYRERGVLRRFAAAGFPRWSFAIAQLIVGLLTTAVACALLLAVAAPVYGIPAVHDAWRVAVALPLGAVAFVSIGVLLGSLLPSARAAQAVGLLLFFPSFLLGAGGPPPHVMGSVVKQVAGPLPLTLLTNAVRAPWLGLGTATGSLIGVAVLAVAATAVAARRTAL
jgi:ABC-type multidrug transport system ATPase subunit/ABC-type multidrug transport system permease subunit